MALLLSRRAQKGSASRLWLYLTTAFLVGFATDAVLNGSGGCRCARVDFLQLHAAVHTGQLTRSMLCAGAQKRTPLP